MTNSTRLFNHCQPAKLGGHSISFGFLGHTISLSWVFAPSELIVFHDDAPGENLLISSATPENLERAFAFIRDLVRQADGDEGLPVFLRRQAD